MGAIDTRLADLGLATDSFKTRICALTPGQRTFYQRLLRSFAARGTSPSNEWIQTESTILGLDAEHVLSRLAESDLIVRSSDGAIAAAYPFSADRTLHRVELGTGQHVYAMCAIDALGIPYMLNRDATIVSRDVTAGERVRIVIQNGHGRWEPPQAVVFVGAGHDEGPLAERCCVAINFFASPDSAYAYQSQHPELSGVVLTREEASDVAGRLFGDLLRCVEK